MKDYLKTLLQRQEVLAAEIFGAPMEQQEGQPKRQAPPLPAAEPQILPKKAPPTLPQKPATMCGAEWRGRLPERQPAMPQAAEKEAGGLPDGQVMLEISRYFERDARRF